MKGWDSWAWNLIFISPKPSSIFIFTGIEIKFGMDINNDQKLET